VQTKIYRLRLFKSNLLIVGEASVKLTKNCFFFFNNFFTRNGQTKIRNVQMMSNRISYRKLLFFNVREFHIGIHNFI